MTIKPPSPDSAQILGATIMQRLDELARFSSEAPALTRLYLTPAYVAAARHLKSWMEEAGMSVTIDAAYNVIGRYEGHDPEAPALMIGSHFDTVRNAGRYDGNYGVVAAIAVIADLHRRGERLSQAIKVAAFGDEEGVRFPVAMTGSRSLAGALNPRILEAKDNDGITLAEALIAAGCDPNKLADCKRKPGGIAAYFELHIEQGPVLQEKNKALGAVTAIAGATRAKVVIQGVAGHAGAVPMGLRADALAAAAEMILAVERIAQQTKHLVGTVGVIDVAPKAGNVIPAFAEFSLDVRSEFDAVRAAGLGAMIAEFNAIAAHRKITFTFNIYHDAPAVHCDKNLLALCEEAIRAVGETPERLSSGAGHDAMVMAALTPVAMLFLRCKDGVSHNPRESITLEDAGLGALALREMVRRFAAKPATV